jgi:hypothetical protein
MPIIFASTYFMKPAVPVPIWRTTIRPQSPRLEYDSWFRLPSMVATHTVVLPTTLAAMVAFQASRMLSSGWMGSWPADRIPSHSFAVVTAAEQQAG